MKTILVSIVCLTYNHEKYISDALNSFLAQQTNFNFEIIIHDDASTDKTAEIVALYTAKHPEIIRPFYQTKNQYVNEGLFSIYNFAFQKCRGKYIAYCEGDDWYSDIDKLQKQVDFMDAHQDHGLVHTGFKRFKNDSNRMSSYDSTKHIPKQGDVFADLLILNHIAAPTTLFRSDLAIKAMKELLPTSKKDNWLTADYPIWLHIAMNNKIGYLPDVTTINRLSRDSLSSAKKYQRFLRFSGSVKAIKEFFIQFAKVDQDISEKTLARCTSEMYRFCLKNGIKDRAIYRKSFLKYSHALPGRTLLKFYSKHPLLEFLYI